ncbi:MAG: ABC transporter ATP-binding protein [Planctomycetes bacterium]|nr:ABC transporter ATP-binding protein [Planctomycetota bacterium]
MLAVRDLTKSFTGPGGEVRALAGVSFELAAGDFLAVQGHSGSGKTTLLLACGALQRPDSGSVTIAGQDPYRLGAEERAAFRARHIGFVFQQFHLIPYLTVLENVLAPLLALNASAAPARAMELLERFQIQDRAAHRPQQLSTGERQRTALARALLHRPKLILADEPTGNLDEQNADTVLDSLRELAKEGAAVLMVTHDNRLAAKAARVLALEHGRPKAEAAHAH